MDDFVTEQELIEEPQDCRPHVVLLGAGASLAAFPEGEKNGKKLPLMKDLVGIVGLRPLLEKAGLGEMHKGNFEEIYRKLSLQSEMSGQASGAKKDVLKKLEQCIERYFSDMSLPDEATIYDRLLVSLRPKDAIFTFNWDPFLFDAYWRNHAAVPLPSIYFLHGNVRIGACPQCRRWGARGGKCPDCPDVYSDVPLLYPFAEKNHTGNPYIKRSWDAAEIFFKKAFTITIFGYSAPDSDEKHVNLLEMAWFKGNERELEHIEIIDTARQSLLESQWEDFTPTRHYTIRETFEESWIARWSRRSCEFLSFATIEGKLCADISFPQGDNLVDIQKRAVEISQHESNTINDA